MEIPSGYGLEKLKVIVACLRNPNGGCPWDLEQTHESLKQYLLEESYEVLEAIESKPTTLREELGDLLLQVFLHSQIASEAGNFSIDDVAESIATKLIRRHPHVFGTTAVQNSGQVLENWERIKQKELTSAQSILDGVPRAMPALLRAQRTGEKAARVGFDWQELSGVKEKIVEELQELMTAFAKDPASPEVAEEFGDLLFSLAQLGRKLGFDCEDILQQATTKFSGRFKRMEQLASKPLKELSADELDRLWNQVKAE